MATCRRTAPMTTPGINNHDATTLQLREFYGGLLLEAAKMMRDEGILRQATATQVTNATMSALALYGAVMATMAPDKGGISEFAFLAQSRDAYRFMKQHVK